MLDLVGLFSQVFKQKPEGVFTARVIVVEAIGVTAKERSTIDGRGALVLLLSAKGYPRRPAFSRQGLAVRGLVEVGHPLPINSIINAEVVAIGGPARVVIIEANGCSLRRTDRSRVERLRDSFIKAFGQTNQRR